jgi:protein-L-isoaspartate(D-aspartate) O-methyltransferase
VLPAVAPCVTVVTGPLAAGWPANGPYDLILVEGSVPALPAALAEQIHRESGRILAAIHAEGRATQAVIAEATAFGISVSPLFDCGTPPIPSLRKAPMFAF